MKRIIAMIAITNVPAIAYVHGWRIADLSDTPSSQRPWGALVAGTTSGDYLSELTH